MKKSLKLSFLISGFSSLSILPIVAISCNSEKPKKIEENKTDKQTEKETENKNTNDQKAGESKQDSNVSDQDKTEETNKENQTENTEEKNTEDKKEGQANPDHSTSDSKEQNQAGNTADQAAGSTESTNEMAGDKAGEQAGDSSNQAEENHSSTPDQYTPKPGAENSNQDQEMNSDQGEKHKNTASDESIRDNNKTLFVLKSVDYISKNLKDKLEQRLDANYTDFKTEFLDPNRERLNLDDPIYAKDTFNGDQVKAKLLEIDSNLANNTGFNDKLYYIKVSQQFKDYSEKLTDLYTAVNIENYPLSFRDEAQVRNFTAKVKEALGLERFAALKEFVKLASQKPMPSDYFFIESLTKDIVSEFTKKQTA